jgi:[acyl-carrier-protein] S-malonyltransferase
MSKVSFVFPGQGSQSVGMLSELAQEHAVIHTVFEEASDVLAYDLWDLIQSGSASKLNETVYTQVAMLSADVAIFRLIQSLTSLAPSMMAGHSLGEYAALVCSEALSFNYALQAVQQRAQLMQKYVPMGTGAMAAIVGLDNEVVEQLCRQVNQADDQVMPANYNAIGQVVVAGHTAAVERLIQAAELQQARLAKMIPVSVPCHCDLLREMAVEFAKTLDGFEFQMPTCVVLSNVDAQAYTSTDHIRRQLQMQLYKPVRWVETIQNMASQGIEKIVECGPGQVLTGLIKRIGRDIAVMSVNSPATLEKIQQF